MDEASICSEDTSSIYDDERTKKLFQACDVNGDGFIDSQDLLGICRQLNLEESTEELLHDLGANEDGKISYDQFLDRRNALRSEINAFRKKQRASDCVASSSSNSLGKHERWEFDSGARDLSPERNTLQRLVEAAGCESNTKNLLQLANKLHLAAITTAKGEVSDLKARLRFMTEERNALKTQLKDIEDNRLIHVTQQYEEQIIELHSVIAELRKKLECQKVSVIQEEESEAENTAEHETENENIPEASNAPAIQSSDVCPFCEVQNTMNGCEQKNVSDTVAYDILLINKQIAEAVREIEHCGVMDNEMKDDELEEEITIGIEELENYEMMDKKMKELFKVKNKSTLVRLKSQITLLELTVDELRENCERLYLLLGKYESNAIALRESNKLCKDLFLHYLELDTLHTTKKRDAYSLVYEQDTRLSAERILQQVMSMESTVVKLESYQSETKFKKIKHVEVRKYDMEMAVLLQDLTILREKNAALKCELYSLKKYKGSEANPNPFNDKIRTQEVKNTDSNSFQNHLINYLKPSNKLLEKSKRKSSEKIRVLENEVNEITNKHAAQVYELRKKILILEHILQQCESCKVNFSYSDKIEDKN